MDFNFSVSNAPPAAPTKIAAKKDKHQKFLNRHRRKRDTKSAAPKASEPRPQIGNAAAKRKGDMSNQEADREGKSNQARVPTKSSPPPSVERSVSGRSSSSLRAAVAPAEQQQRPKMATALTEGCSSAKAPAPANVSKMADFARAHQPPVDAGNGSRRKPMRATDEEYATFHLSAADLSANAHRVPKESKASTHIFDSGSFASLGVHPKLVTLLGSPRGAGGLGLERPTQVQRLAISTLLQGKSAYIKSQTGSGKTLAYLLPLVHCLASGPRSSR